MKKAVCCILALLTAVVLMTPNSFAAQGIDEAKVKAAFIAEGNSMQCITELNGDTKLDAAGLTRLPALLVICEAIDGGALDMERTVSVSKAASQIKGPTAFIESGESITVEKLLKAAIIISAGDAIYALAEVLSGSDTAFCEQLNARMAELGIDVSFSSCIGAGSAMSARQLALIGSKLMGSESFKKYSGIYLDSIMHENGKETQLANPNKLVRWYQGCSGIATGSSESAGYCGVFSVERGGSWVIGVVLGAKTSDERFEAAKSMLEYGLSSCRTLRVASKGDVIKENVPVLGGNTAYINLVAAEDVVLLMTQGEAEPQKNVRPDETICAPIKAGDALGKLVIEDSLGNELMSVDIVSDRDVEVASFFDYIIAAMRMWVEPKRSAA
ncbi:MAG: D-alanyl-D-alanine carboxypeptidase [Eubacteriales bacterium]|nr:D-alanyl-D-alanine carboxypeptidase [Eubacteriales bacterium]